MASRILLAISFLTLSQSVFGWVCLYAQCESFALHGIRIGPKCILHAGGGMGYTGANNCFGGYICTAVNPCESVI